ncbi:MAG: glutathione peroxidase [Candidatus Kapaibacterium sp.]|nr:MAG: glutathione peroxidase [Candidatus Kapabacteria bacterium]
MSVILALLCLAVVILFTTTNAFSSKEPRAMSNAASIHEFTVNSIEGKPVKLEDYKGKVVLIVNVASRCGFTPQYEGLEKLYKQYSSKGFVVLAFPANNFMGQEPGTDADIKQFCSTKYNVTFPMFSKISVKGDDMHPLYQFLTTKSTPAGDVRWNFGKFLIGKDGKIIARYDSKVAPEAAELTSAIDAALK